MDVSRLHILRKDPDGVIQLQVVGHVTAQDIRPNGVNLIEAVAGPGWRESRMAIDFSDCKYMDSGALGWLIDANKQINQAGGSLVAHSLSENVKRVFAMTRMEHVLAIASDLRSAMSILRP